jgi:hypothetical protein
VRSNFLWTPWRVVAASILIELTLVAVLVRLEATVGAGARVVIVAVLLVGPLGLLFVLANVQFWQVRRVVARAATRRPGSVIIPVSVVALSRNSGRELGLQVAGANTPGGNPGAVVVLRDRLEVWSGRSGEPRWSIGLADVSIGVGTATVGRMTWDVVQLTDGPLSFAVAPRYTANPYQAGIYIDRVLCELGRDPATVHRGRLSPVDDLLADDGGAQGRSDGRDS